MLFTPETGRFAKTAPHLRAAPVERRQGEMRPTILLTGCSRGLGLEFVRQLIAKGGSSTVIATCRSPAGAPQLAALVAAATSVHVLPLDVGDEASIAQLPAALEALGVTSIDTLVHNAGISAPTHPVDPAATASGAVLKNVFNVNCVGPLLLTQTLLPLLRAASAEGGVPAKVFFVSSVMGSITRTTAGGSVSYRASKAALNMVGKVLAGEHGVGTLDNLRFTLCHPGWCATDMGCAGNRSPPVQPEESVAGMLRVIEAMGEQSRADFVDFNGAAIEW